MSGVLACFCYRLAYTACPEKLWTAHPHHHHHQRDDDDDDYGHHGDDDNNDVLARTRGRIRAPPLPPSLPKHLRGPRGFAEVGRRKGNEIGVRCFFFLSGYRSTRHKVTVIQSGVGVSTVLGIDWRRMEREGGR